MRRQRNKYARGKGAGQSEHNDPGVYSTSPRRSAEVGAADGCRTIISLGPGVAWHTDWREGGPPTGPPAGAGVAAAPAKMQQSQQALLRASHRRQESEGWGPSTHRRQESGGWMEGLGDGNFMWCRSAPPRTPRRPTLSPSPHPPSRPPPSPRKHQRYQQALQAHTWSTIDPIPLKVQSH